MIRKIVLALVLVAVCGFISWRYFTTHLPQVTFSVLRFNSLTTEKAEITAVVMIKNSLPLPFGADSISYSVHMNGVQVLGSNHSKSIRIKANDTSSVSLPFTIFANQYSQVKDDVSRRKSDSVDYAFTAVFYTNFFFKKRIEIKEEIRMPLFRLPVIEVKDLVLNMIRLSENERPLQTTITNENSFDMKLKNIHYHFAVFGKRWAEGKREGEISIPSNTTIQVELSSKISTKESGPDVFDIIKKDGTPGYKMALCYMVITGNELLGDVPVFIESEGTAIQFTNTMKKIRE